MSVLQRLTVRTMRLNPKRTLVTIVGVILATALITAVANSAVSLEASLIEYEKYSGGDYHYRFESVDAGDLKYFQNNRMIRKIGVKQDVGYALLSGSRNANKPYLFFMAMDENGMKANAVHLSEGRLPEAEGEIVVPRSIAASGGIDIRLGDVLELWIGDRISDDGTVLDQSYPYESGAERLAEREKATFTVVGKMDSFHGESYLMPGYTVITYLDPEHVQGTVNVYVTYTDAGLRSLSAVNAGLLGISENQYLSMNGHYTEDALEEMGACAKGVSPHRDLLSLEQRQFSDNLSSMLFWMAALAVIIIMAASVFCIRNSFMISLTEKMRLYGMLSSVGATRRQLRGMVYREAWILGLIGIPAGILCGAAATVVVIRVAGGLMMIWEGFGLVYQPSWAAMAAGAALSAAVIFLSAGQSARRASRTSPISAIRGSEMVRERERAFLRKKRGPKSIFEPVIRRLFGIGGVIACKNLRRARSKYRTTVISIVVSVAVFIATSSLLNIGFLLAASHYDSYSWQIMVRLGIAGDSYRGETFEESLKIAALDGIEALETVRACRFFVDAGQVPYSRKYREDYPWADAQQEIMYLYSLGEEGYARYCRKLGLDPDKVENQAILLADYRQEVVEGGSLVIKMGEAFDYKPGDVITGVMEKKTGEKQELSIAVALQTTEHPMCINYAQRGILIVSDSLISRYEDFLGPETDVYIRCEDPEALEREAENCIGVPDYSVYNVAEEYRRSQALYTMLGIFLYGFITVIALIGVTNIFNTITTNMELRSREFAMLRSVGMTGGEFRRMIRLENLFYGAKALAAGIPIGWVLYALFYRILDLRVETGFVLPWKSTLLAAAAVVLLLAGIMRYSLAKIGRQDIVETIQNENR